MVNINKKFKKGPLLLEVIKLGSMGRSISQISDTTSVPRSTLYGWNQRINELNLTYEVAKEMTEEQLVEVMFPQTHVGALCAVPKWDEIHISMGKPGMTLSRCYRSYVEGLAPDQRAMSQTSFYREYEKQKALLPKDVLALNFANSYSPGQIVMIDYCGDTVELTHGSKKGTVLQIFVGVLSYSSMIFAYATEGQRQPDWFKAMAAMYEYFGGVTEEVYLDNARALVSRADKVDPTLSRAFVNFCRQFSVQPVALPPGKPKAKASVERAVGIVQQKILGTVRSAPTASVDDVNKVLRHEVEILNGIPLTDGSKQSRYDRFREEQRYLKALPYMKYDVDCEIVDRQILKSNQVRLDNVRYGVCWGHVGSMARLYINRKENRVDIYLKDSFELIGQSPLVKAGTKIGTKAEDLPEPLKRYRENLEQLLERVGKEIGPSAKQLALHLSKYTGSQATRYINGLLTISHRYDSQEMEVICSEVMAGPSKTYQTLIQVAALHKKQNGSKPLHEPSNGCVRGAQYYRKTQLKDQSPKEENNEQVSNS